MYHIIVNPSSKSGLAKTQWKELKKILDHKKVTYIVHFTKSEKELRQYTKSVTDKRLYLHNARPNRLIVLGGDGTLNCVLNGVDDMQHTIISYMPTGTSNDFARATKIATDAAGVVSALKKVVSPPGQMSVSFVSDGVKDVLQQAVALVLTLPPVRRSCVLLLRICLTDSGSAG